MIYHSKICASRCDNLGRPGKSCKLRDLILIQATAESSQDGENCITQASRKSHVGTTGATGLGLGEGGVGDLVDKGYVQRRIGVNLDEESRRVVLECELGPSSYGRQMRRWGRSGQRELGRIVMGSCMGHSTMNIWARL